VFGLISLGFSKSCVLVLAGIELNFLSGSWCSAVFWIWDENNVDNILMFWVAARQSRTFQLLLLAWPARCTGSWEGTQPDMGTQPGQLTQTGQRDLLFRVTPRSV